MPPREAGRLVRVYLDRGVVERLESEAARITGELGRFATKADIYGAIAAVGLAHREEVVGLLQPPTTP